MPYIKPHLRLKAIHHPINSGQLNYAITKSIDNYLVAYQRENGRINYEAFNDVAGALNNAYQEFYRRIVAPYEDEKINENRDVYNEELLKL